VLRMTLDDATDMLTCAFSLDGGTTFQSPFAPMHVFNSGVVDYEVLLGAAVTTAAPPPPPPPAPQFVPMRSFEADNPSRDLVFPKGVTELQTVFNIPAGTTINGNAHVHFVEEALFAGR